MNFLKINRVTHRDLGYLIAGMCIIYALSGIALNHKNNWNPNYRIDNRSFSSRTDFSRQSFSDDNARQILADAGLANEFKTWYFPSGNNVTIFLEGGFVQYNISEKSGKVETISKRPLFYQLNFLHFNPGRWWKYFSDLFCLSLITVAVTGLFILKGKNGITGRGAILTLAGIILPLLFLFFYI